MDIITAETIASVAQKTVVVKVAINHGDYRAEFYGSGSTVLEAAKEAAGQSSYSTDLFDEASNFYESRARYRAGLELALNHGEVYRGFGWCDFSRIA